MYPLFSKEAEAEGEKEAAKLFADIGKVEKNHEARFKKLLKMVEEGTVFKREKPIRWKCSKCGHIHEGTEPPEKCPTCDHPREYFEPEDMCSF
jgi:rubrerythrin